MAGPGADKDYMPSELKGLAALHAWKTNTFSGDATDQGDEWTWFEISLHLGDYVLAWKTREELYRVRRVTRDEAAHEYPTRVLDGPCQTRESEPRWRGLGHKTGATRDAAW